MLLLICAMSAMSFWAFHANPFRIVVVVVPPVSKAMRLQPQEEGVGARSPHRGLAERRAKGGERFDPHEELLVLNQRAVIDLPADHPQLVERIGLVGFLQV